MKKGITLLQIFFIQSIFIAQGFQPVFSNINIDDGLSGNVVFCVTQDEIGYIWIGTSSGLDRYDGVKFKHYHNNPFDSTSLSANLVQDIMHDSKGRMWVSTRNGLNLYSRSGDNFQRFVVNEKDSAAIQNDDIWRSYEDRFGFIWLCTRRNGLIRLDTDEREFIQYKHDENDTTSISADRVTDIIEDNEGNLYVIAVSYKEFGLNKYNRESDLFLRVRNSELETSMNVVAKDEAGKFWLGSFEIGLVEYNTGNGKHKLYPLPGGNHTIRSLILAREKKVWLGTSDGGVYKFDPLNKNFQFFLYDVNNANGISFQTIWDIYEDNRGTIWLGTFGGGVNIINPKQEIFNLDFIENIEIRNNLKDVTSFLKLKNGDLLIGTFGNGLFIKRKDLTENILPESNHSIKLLDNRINQIIQDKTGNIWIATVVAITVIDSNYNTIRIIEEGQTDRTLSSGAINDLLVDNKNNIWVATHNGLNILSNYTEKVKWLFHNKNDINSILRNHIYDLFLDSENLLWIATAGGVSSLSADRKEYTHYIASLSIENTISSNFITNITEDENKDIWISTLGGGVNRIERVTGKITSFDESNGLADNRASSIICGNDSTLWIGTKGGLSRLNTKNQNIANFYDVQGLSSNEFSGNAAYKSDDGRIFLGSIKGFNSFHPEQIASTANEGRLILTNFKLFNKDYKFEHCVEDIEKIELNYEQNFFTFEFSLLDYTYPVKNRYKYKLEGVDIDWIDAGNRNHADYTSIDPGEYIFRVIAANSENIWTKNELHVALVIYPPYYQTWWFIILVIITILFILFGIYKYRIHQINKLQMLRDNIHKNLHDELGSTLTSINYFARALKNDLGKPAKFLDNIITGSDDARERIKDMMWVVNPNNDSVIDLFSRIQRFASDIFEGNNINYSIEIPNLTSDYKISMQSRQNFWLIIKEITANIIKHSKAKNVHLKIELDEFLVKINIDDDGIGFKKESMKKGEGVKNIKKRVEEMNGTIQLTAEPGVGTGYFLMLNLK